MARDPGSVISGWQSFIQLSCYAAAIFHLCHCKEKAEGMGYHPSVLLLWGDSVGYSLVSLPGVDARWFTERTQYIHCLELNELGYRMNEGI